MTTHRHRRAGLVLMTATALLLGAQAPAQAAVTTSTRSAHVVSAHTLQLAQHRLQARRAEAAAHRRALARIAAVRAARTAAVNARNAAAAARAAAAAQAATVAAAAAAAAAPVLPAVPVVAAPAAPASPSGVAAPHGDLPGWTQTYVEDFTRPATTGAFASTYASHWDVYEDGWKDTSKNGTYMPSKVLSVHDGLLDYAVRTEGGQHLVSAPVLKDTYGQVYGRYSVRFRSDSLPGYKTAWLLWPDSEKWPADGEIDFPEGNLDGTIGGYAHHASAAGTQDAFETATSFSAWHTATIEWVPGKVSFVLDGKVLGSSTKDVPATAMHWVLQTETALDGGAPSAGVAGHVLVDWVALYKRA